MRIRTTGRRCASAIHTAPKMTHVSPKFIIFTWGCQMNEDDSEQIAGILTQLGYSATDDASEADLAVLVTCSVRAKPEEKAKSKLGELALIKKKRPELMIGVCGCMAQRLGDSLRKHRPYVDFVLGTAAIPRLPQVIEEVKATGSFVSDLELRDAQRTPPPRVQRTGASLKSFITVMHGCDNYCAYCIVPFVRGRERSRSVEDVVAEVRQLAETGRKEITLLGQNVNSYGATSPDGRDFADLLRAVSEIDGIERIRFTTSHPKDLSDRLIDAVRVLPKVCEHIHLPVQSGDDEVLARMNRKYTVSQYLERVNALREAAPEIAITTDFLVGFPGETEEQFRNTLQLAEQVRFDSAFMFAFNAIPGTAAAGMEGALPGPVKLDRLNRLIQLQNRITCEINAGQVGRLYEVLVECRSSKNERMLSGRTRQNKTVNFPGDASLIGKLVQVETTEAHLYGFVGRRVE